MKIDTLGHDRTTAVLYNGLGRYEKALAAAQQGAGDSLEVQLAAWGVVELIAARAAPS